MVGIPFRSIFGAAGEIIRKHFPFAGRFSILKRSEYYIKTGLRKRRPIPGTMESDKRTIFIFSRKLIPRIKQ